MEEEGYNDHIYTDVLCQRAQCMAEVALTLQDITDKEVRQELISVMRKLNMSIRVPTSAEVVKLVVDTGSNL